MIRLLIAGGLGNQLFQYAAAWTLARRLATKLVVDTLFYTEHEGPRAFRLDELNHSSKIKWHNDHGLFAAHGFLCRAKRKLWDSSVFSYYNEPGLGYDGNFFKLKDGAVISGLFQSYEYIELCGDLRKELDVSLKVSSSILSKDYSQYVSVHVRRGDYISLPGFLMENAHSYYASAMCIVSRQLGRPKFLIFSDDIEWCMRQRVFAKNCEFFDGPGSTDFDALYAMSRCGYHIIANSSFSLWAAMVSGKGGIAPAEWISGIDTRGAKIVPSDRWITV